jgi:hypothetical protein
VLRSIKAATTPLFAPARDMQGLRGFAGGLGPKISLTRPLAVPDAQRRIQDERNGRHGADLHLRPASPCRLIEPCRMLLDLRYAGPPPSGVLRLFFNLFHFSFSRSSSLSLLNAPSIGDY